MIERKRIMQSLGACYLSVTTSIRSLLDDGKIFNNKLNSLSRTLQQVSSYCFNSFFVSVGTELWNFGLSLFLFVCRFRKGCKNVFQLKEMKMVFGRERLAHADGAIVYPQLTGYVPPLPRFLPFFCVLPFNWDPLERQRERERPEVFRPSPLFLLVLPSALLKLRLLSRYLDAHIHNIYTLSSIYHLIPLFRFWPFGLQSHQDSLYASWYYGPYLSPSKTYCDDDKDALFSQQQKKKKGRRRRGSLF